MYRGILPLIVVLYFVTLAGCSEPSNTVNKTEQDNEPGRSAVEVADQIMINGKILTVDDEFSIVEAVAIRKGRILGVGSNSDISAMAGPDTEITDLQGRTVVPGLIDNHHHFVRASEQWYRHVRWDEVSSRETALGMLQERARQLPPGEWIVVLGGWIYEQFRDDSSPFTVSELDSILPENPLYIQLGYSHGYANSLALRTAGIDDNTVLTSPGVIIKDENGKLTGEFIGAWAFLRVAGSIPPVPPDIWDNSLQLTINDYIKAGVTALLDVGGNTVTPRHYDAVKRAAAAGNLPMRVFYTLNSTNGVGPTAGEIIESLSTNKPNLGNDMFDQFAYGEMTYPGIRDPFGGEWNPQQEQIDNYIRIAKTAADNGWQIHEHSTRADKIAALLDMFEKVAEDYPVKELRWTMAHCENITDASIDRAINLGVLFALHSSAGLGAPAIAAQFGRDAVNRVPPIRTIHDKGGIWGLGSDGTVVSGYNPFQNIGWAVTGKARSGEKYLEETVSREAALIAHTRSNAYLLFKEDVLGSLEPGKYADLVILDRDYMTIDEDEIFTIQPVMTIIAGKVVYRQD